MKERTCRDKALESRFFEADDSFIIKLTVNIDGKRIPLLGIVKTPPTLVSLLEIPLSSSKSEDLSGIDKTVLRVNNESLSNNGLPRQDLFQSLARKFEASEDFEVRNDDDSIMVIKSLLGNEEIEGRCPNGNGVDCVGKVMRACTLMRDIEKGSDMSIKTSFRNLGLFP